MEGKADPLGHEPGSARRGFRVRSGAPCALLYSLSAIILDLRGVFFVGATALLPIYAADILHIGATGLGWLRAAPAVGAGLTAIWIAHRPAFRNAGMVLLASVAAFGAATIGFAISTSAW